MFQASQAASPTFRLPRPPPRLLTYILPCFILCLASPCVPTSATFGLTGATARGSRVLPAEIQHILPRRHNASRNLLCSKAVTRLFLTLGSPASLPQTWSHTGAACPLHLRTGRCLTHRCSVRLALGQLGPASVLGSHVVCGTVSSRTSFSPWHGGQGLPALSSAMSGEDGPWGNPLLCLGVPHTSYRHPASSHIMWGDSGGRCDNL